MSADRPKIRAVFDCMMFLQAARRECSVPALEWMVEIGTWLMRTESELVLKSRRVVPGRLLAAGFQFAFPEWPAAARELVGRWRATNQK
jgi:NAD dependent epimerase/dehydratase family enzyme